MLYDAMPIATRTRCESSARNQAALPA